MNKTGSADAGSGLRVTRYGVCLSSRIWLFIPDTFLDVFHHRGADDILAMGDTHVLDRTPYDFSLSVGAGVPITARHKSSAFKTFHDLSSMVASKRRNVRNRRLFISGDEKKARTGCGQVSFDAVDSV